MAFLGACFGIKNCKRRRDIKTDTKEAEIETILSDAAFTRAKAKLLLMEAQSGSIASGSAEDNSDASASGSDDTLLYGGIAASVLLVVVIVVLIKKKKK